MDFGFAPDGEKGDEHIPNLRSLFERRATTTLINGGGVDTIRQFIAHLDKTTAITKPIGDLVIGAHANNEGQFFITSFPGQRGPTQFETLEDSLKDTKKSIKIPDTLIDFTTGSAITHFVHIKGCNLGQAMPFVTKLKEALGGHVNLTVPRLFHGATPSPEGMFEYIGYQFPLNRTQEFANRKDAVQAWDSAGFTLIDGSPVTTADWEAVIPQNPNRGRRINVNSKLGTSIGKRTTVRTPQQYRVLPIDFGPWNVPFPTPQDVPTNKSDQLLALEIDLKKRPRFQTTHPYPQFTREGFGSVIEFVSGYEWAVRRAGPAALDFFGRRTLFMVALAITDPTTVPTGKLIGDGTLIFNFFPNSGSTLTAKTSAIQVTDQRFFVTV
jgi:hypothetical protein